MSKVRVCILIRCRSPPFQICLLTQFTNLKMEEFKMTILKRIPDYKKLYPEASEEVIDVLKQSERKMIYQEYDIKSEKFKVDIEKQRVFFIPSREDSLERLVESAAQFKDESMDVEKIVIDAIVIEQLKESLKLLDKEEYELITALFYEGKSEREYAAQCGISRTTLQYRKYRILEKLKNIL